MNLDICKERDLIRKGLVIRTDEVIERLVELNRLWEGLATERISITRSLHDYVTDCPALEGTRKLFPTKDVYGRYGCTGCAYYFDEYLQYVRCKWRAAREAQDSDVKSKSCKAESVCE